jgi:hypothetical protein
LLAGANPRSLDMLLGGANSRFSDGLFRCFFTIVLLTIQSSKEAVVRRTENKYLTCFERRYLCG